MKALLHTQKTHMHSNIFTHSLHSKSDFYLLRQEEKEEGEGKDDEKKINFPRLLLNFFIIKFKERRRRGGQTKRREN
jgi:hypothetical protein